MASGRLGSTRWPGCDAHALGRRTKAVGAHAVALCWPDVSDLRLQDSHGAPKP
jgi:hypothetical protein